MIQSPLLRAWPRMLENLGRAVRSDPRDGKALGGYVNLLNIDGATVLERSGDKVAATGVRWTKNGSTYEATAATEVVLAAGSIASPQLLEVSSIGDEFATKPGVPTKEDYANATYFQEQLDLYIQNKTGRLSSAGASSVLLSLKQIASTLDLDTLSLGAKTGKPCLDEQYRLLIRDLKSKAIAQELNIEGGMSPLFSSDTTKFFSANAPGNFVSILVSWSTPSPEAASTSSPRTRPFTLRSIRVTSPTQPMSAC
ncbi:Glucose oxidase 1 [Colletotrichum sp. SAR11_59]|nr:Glucose oxidase 1 [Colletotrichum sp. SAR11_59]